MLYFSNYALKLFSGQACKYNIFITFHFQVIINNLINPLLKHSFYFCREHKLSDKTLKTHDQVEFPQRKSGKIAWKLAVLLIAIFGSVWTGYYVYPDIIAAALGYQSYFRPDWAHQSQTLEELLRFCLAIWLLLSVVFFSFWLMRRSIRTLQGKSWRVYLSDKRKHFFPNILAYLKLSCFFLALVWFFVIAQYPLQFLN